MLLGTYLLGLRLLQRALLDGLLVNRDAHKLRRTDALAQLVRYKLEEGSHGPVGAVVVVYTKSLEERLALGRRLLGRLDGRIGAALGVGVEARAERIDAVEEAEYLIHLLDVLVA